MNKLELDIIMECFGLEKSECYQIGGCNFYHDGRYFTIVEGRVPYDLAKLINEKYDNNKYQIRVNGDNEDKIPEGDVYTYHIDTIEGLVAFLLEMQNYYSEDQLCDEKMEAFLNSVYTNILNNVNPRMNVYDWMLDRENKNEYFKTLLTMNSYINFRVRRKIEEFDNALNPFCNSEIEINNYGFAVDGFVCNDCNGFALYDKENNITMRTIREKAGFVINLRIVTDAPYEINIYHYYNKNGEELAFEHYNEFGLSRIEYNLTDNTFGEHYGEKHLVTNKDKKFVLENLQYYINLANNIFKEHLSKSYNEKVKKKL